jgi:hypothetical protein
MLILKNIRLSTIEAIGASLKKQLVRDQAGEIPNQTRIMAIVAEKAGKVSEMPISEADPKG